MINRWHAAWPTRQDKEPKSLAMSLITRCTIILMTSCLVAGCSTENGMSHGSFILAPSDLLTEISGEWLNIENHSEENLVVAPASSFGFLDGNPASLLKGEMAIRARQTVPLHQKTGQLYILNGQLVRIEDDLRTASTSAASVQP